MALAALKAPRTEGIGVPNTDTLMNILQLLLCFVVQVRRAMLSSYPGKHDTKWPERHTSCAR